jgi:hypothetical protein
VGSNPTPSALTSGSTVAGPGVGLSEGAQRPHRARCVPVRFGLVPAARRPSRAATWASRRSAPCWWIITARDEEWPARRITSASVAPLWAASVRPVCRRSCRWPRVATPVCAPCSMPPARGARGACCRQTWRTAGLSGRSSHGSGDARPARRHPGQAGTRSADCPAFGALSSGPASGLIDRPDLQAWPPGPRLGATGLPCASHRRPRVIGRFDQLGM